ncbi:ATP-binding protein [Streptomyces sp. NPDC050610]
MILFNIECAVFEIDGVVLERRFDAPLTALAGETESGKSTLLEAL